MLEDKKNVKEVFENERKLKENLCSLCFSEPTPQELVIGDWRLVISDVGWQKDVKEYLKNQRR